MEITSITLHRYELPLEEPFVTSMRPIYGLGRILVEVETSDGIVGFGEAAPAHEVTGETAGSTFAVLEDVLAPFVIGEDPLATECLTDKMRQFVDGSHAAHAGIELALQDIRGKSADMPLFKLLGGHGDEARVSVPAVLSMKTPEEMAADAEDAVDDGYRQIKIKIGDDPDTDVHRIDHVAAAIPDDVSLKVDVNQAWRDAKTTLSVMLAIEADLDALEQPVAPENVADLALVRERTDVPVMPDESVESPADASNLIRQGAGDVFNIKLMKTGGITEAVRLNAVAEADHRRAQLGSMVEGHIGTAAGVHFVAAFDNVIWNELVGPFMTTTGIGDLAVDRPEITVSDPGLGVSVDRERLASLRTDRAVIE